MTEPLIDPDDPWWERGACRTGGADPEWFFSLNKRSKESRRAKAFCRVCPVKFQCLEDALKHEDTYGVWGGTDRDERLVLLAKRRTNSARL